MKRNSPINPYGLALAMGIAVTLCFYDATPPQQVASVGPLLDSMATICGEAFDVKRHKLTVVDGEVQGCEVKP